MRPVRLGMRTPKTGIHINLTILSFKTRSLLISSLGLGKISPRQSFFMTGCKCSVAENGNYPIYPVLEKLIYCKRKKTGRGGNPLVRKQNNPFSDYNLSGVKDVKYIVHTGFFAVGSCFQLSRNKTLYLVALVLINLFRGNKIF